MSSPTADWEKVGDNFYRKIKFYDTTFDQELELENHIIAGAPYGGAIGISNVSNFSRWFLLSILALYRDQERIQTYRSTPSSRSSIDVYSCAGRLIRRINVGQDQKRLRLTMAVKEADGFSGIKAPYVDSDGRTTKNSL